MEFLTCIIAAEEDEYPEIAESPAPLNEWSGIELPGMDTLKIATLHSLLTGDTLQMALDLYEPVLVTQNESETLILRINDEMFEELALLDEAALENVAGELGATEAFENDGLSLEDLEALLTALTDLAQLAESQGQSLFVWIKLIHD